MFQHLEPSEQSISPLLTPCSSGLWFGLSGDPLPAVHITGHIQDCLYETSILVCDNWFVTVCCHEQQPSMNPYQFSFIRAIFYEAKIKPVVIRKSGSFTDVLPPFFSIICVCSLQFCDSWDVAELSVCRIIRLQNTELTDWFLISGLRGVKMVWLHGWHNLTGCIIPLLQSRTGMLQIQ